MGYYREIDDTTHIFRENWLGPAEYYGYRSFCEAHQLPVVGEHFELAEVEKHNVTCESCREAWDSSRQPRQQDVKMRTCEGHIVEVSETDGRIDQIRTHCYTIRFKKLVLNVAEFGGDLSDRETDICESCWQGYEERQWRGREEGGMIKVEAETDTGIKQFHADSIDAEPGCAGSTDVVLTSIGGITKQISRDDILSIAVTPTRRVTH